MLHRSVFSLRYVRFVAVLALIVTTPSLSAETEGLTAVPGVRVGHHVMEGRPTGCTVVLVEEGAVGGVDVRGAAPGTRETDLLDPVNSVNVVHAVVLSGGSAFGLDAASGVMRFLEERGVGFDTGVARVPIVPAAVLFDLRVGNDPRIRPTAECGYEAARSASDRPSPEGNVGAGAGATVGKLRGQARAMKGGLGTASVRVGEELVVAALVVVNAVGDIVDPATGDVVAGVRTEDGRRLADARKLLVAGEFLRADLGQNTTLGVVATNARLTKAQAKRVAQVAHDGLARSIYPAHTPGDGDTLFVLSIGTVEADLGTVGALAAEVVARAVLRAVRAATGLEGLPAASDLARGTSSPRPRKE